MRKLIALAVVCTTALVFAAVAYAVNVYTVTPASTKGGGGARALPPSPSRRPLKFGFKTKDSGGGRATPIKRYKIGFQGLKYFGKNKVFPKCTIRQGEPEAGVRRQGRLRQGLPRQGRGEQPRRRDREHRHDLTTCLLRLTLYNTGRGFALRLDGGNTAKPPTKCPIAVNQAINALIQRARSAARRRAPRWSSSVPSNLLHPGSPDISNAIETTNSTISGKTRKVKIKGKTRKVSILSSVKCGKRKRTIQVSFTDEKNSTVQRRGRRSSASDVSQSHRRPAGRLRPPRTSFSGWPRLAFSSSGDTYSSTAAAAEAPVPRSPTVTTVAASSSSQRPLRLATSHAASGRKSAVSSGNGVGQQADDQERGRHVRAGRRRSRRPAADAVGLGGEREEGRRDHEADRELARLLVHPAVQAAAVGGGERQRAAGHEPGDAGHPVQRQHERVAVQDVHVVGCRRLDVEPRNGEQGQVRRGQRGDHPDRRAAAPRR